MQQSENKTDAPLIMGDASRLSVEKKTYIAGEPICVRAVGTNDDWVGIYLPNYNDSVRWFYVDRAHGPEAPGSGRMQDIRKSFRTNEQLLPHVQTIPAGDYVIRLMPGGSTDIFHPIAECDIHVLPDCSKRPPAPLAVSYASQQADGFAAGEVTIDLPEDRPEDLDLRLFWADEKGPLDTYKGLAKFRVTGSRTVFSFPKNLIIPEGARRLICRTSVPGTELFSEGFASCSLPENASFQLTGTPRCAFTVISDTHLTTDPDHIHNRHFRQMLEDSTETVPDSMGLFIVGDMGDNGQEEEYAAIYQMQKAVPGAPPIYLAVGNHDLWAGDFHLQMEKFLRSAYLPDGSHPSSPHYDFRQKGFHFIFLGNDCLLRGLDTTLSDHTLRWLEEKLAEDEPDKPVFVFLHQSLYNTVAGSLPGEAWNGVAEESEAPFRAVLKHFPNVILFNGHSHWTMDSVSNFYPADQDLPNIFNTASCAYLWQSYNMPTGEGLEGSEGYDVWVYADKILLRGRDFVRKQWISSAQYCLPLPPAQS